MGLEEYNKKRNFTQTPEPSGGDIARTETQRFVVQRHQARKLHYDLRLEINGSLKSWAVPKGPSMNPSDKRLAVRTEDHPLKYLDFHGTIPKGNYGAGEMIVWDSGVFEIDRTELDLSANAQLLKGNLKIIFRGKKLRGHFALVQTGERNGRENWLFIKKKDGFSTNIPYDAEALLPISGNLQRSKPKKIIPGQILQPMLAGSRKEIFNDPDWIYELKWDGYRVLAHVTKKGVFLQSRNGIDLGLKFRVLAEELEQIENETILDGEVVVLNEEGVSVFGELQNYPDSKGFLRFYVFDMLFLNGHSMLELPLRNRKSLIPQVVENLNITRYCDHIEAMGTALFEKALESGMEGVMAKQIDSDYSPGARTEKWLKIKSVDNIDALICGYTDSVKGGSVFGSLILGVEEDGKLVYVGNCGTGFSEAYRKELLKIFEPYRTDKNPFKKKLSLKGRRPNWLEPGLVCEVKYSERTKNGLLRNPVFKRLKDGPAVLKNPTPDRPTTASPTSPSITGQILDIDSLPVSLTHLDKVYWPESGMTKYDLIDYYIQMSDTILPHLTDRPQSLHRHPNGITGDGFYQKDNESVPEWMETATIHSKSSERDIDYLLCQNTASLIYMANLGCIEINPWNSRVGQLDRPDYGIIDLDPPEGMDFANVVKVAQEFGKILDIADIPGYCKTSGSKGLHIFVPMGAQYTYEEVRNFIKLLCHFVEARLPEISTLERRIKNRNGKIYLDYLQNRKGQTIASVYSVRPLPNAPVSAPVAWEELDGRITPRQFTIKNMPSRIEEIGDLFEPMGKFTCDMESWLQNLDGVE
ncbi:DNA ligase D [Pricia sp.]|uniref:DNA ligase D n=1 Tax=Pricia sp. TaxID=2268138 RepID=UPI003593DCB8